ncbi:winged helix DNA-binding domain-containing protein [Sanguibacter sp. HDW7]|uniref:winged helix DNA-binding domain-containing protein n=1 Tax=Sanguibacter sp. HDW7 TaxID=2714931 RepID=UPI00140DBFE7|nr:winged helix DNA-binding domain-containing protein [Sanguibacter sp. HDW7]QIK83167.1 winged helix DNA-binding domain-containing protein [Sanguibacter sp. HDW7]
MGHKLTARDVRRVRVASLGLDGRFATGAGADDVVAAASGLLAVQGQDLGQVLWALGLRAGATVTQVREAFTRGDLVWLWPLRGTLHALAADDLPWLLSLTGERMRRAAARRREQLGIADRDLEAARTAAVSLMHGGGASRATLLAAFVDAGQGVAAGRGYHLIVDLAVQGVLALGPFDGTEHLFVLLDELVPDLVVTPRATAVRTLVERYVRGHGPATPADVARWCGLPLGDLRPALADLADAGVVTSVEIPSGPAWVVPDALDAAPRATGVLLLPGFDELVLGYADRTATLTTAHETLIVPGGNGVFKPVVVADGRAVATWTAGRDGSVSAEPLSRPLTAAVERGVRVQARHVERFRAG